MTKQIGALAVGDTGRRSGPIKNARAARKAGLRGRCIAGRQRLSSRRECAKPDG